MQYKEGLRREEAGSDRQACSCPGRQRRKPSALRELDTCSLLCSSSAGLKAAAVIVGSVAWETVQREQS